MRKYRLNTSFKHHTILASVISLWLVVFLIFIAPFDTSDLNMVNRLRILPIYGVLSFGVYLLLIPVQNYFFKRYETWNWSLELFFILIYDIILLFFSYSYYKTDIVNGLYDFKIFSLKVYLPICLILFPILFLLRRYINKRTTGKRSTLITLKGDNKLDILRISPEDLICISSADNYVEVSYLIRGELQKKLLRHTLKGIQNDVPNLIKIHRSYLINPTHFKEWNGSNSIILTEMEVPVSKNYRATLLEVI